MARNQRLLSRQPRFSIDVRDMPMNLAGLRMRMARNEKSYDHFLASH